MEKFKIPVLIIAFNRPKITENLIKELKKIKPKEIFFAVDGPRKNNKEDKIKVKETQEVIKNIDWPCKVKKLIRTENKGCKYGPAEAIDWLFKNVDKGIILEDDCLPNKSFFKFCEQLLEKYKDDERIMHISGTNYNRNWKSNLDSYYFSKYPFIWGWATWRRAWNKYDIEMKNYEIFKKETYLKQIFPNKLEAMTIKKGFKTVYKTNFTAWDHQWLYTVISNNGLSIVPNENLITNIGMGADATHTNTKLEEKRSLPTKELKFPLKHPEFILQNKESDKYYFKWIFIQKIINTLLTKTGLMKFFIKNK